MNRRSLIIILILTVLNTLLLAIPLPGVLITNQATGEYIDMNGVSGSVESNVVTTQINPFPAFIIEPDGTTELPGQYAQAVPGEVLAFSFMTRNTGNVSLNVTLSVLPLTVGSPLPSHEADFIDIYLDENGNGFLDPGEVLINSVDLNIGEAKNVLLVFNIPGEAYIGDIYYYDFTGTDIDNEIVDESNVVMAEVISDSVLEITKTVSRDIVSPDENLLYSLTIHNPGPNAMNNVFITDYIDYMGMSVDGKYIPGSLQVSKEHSLYWFDGSVFQDSYPENPKGFKLLFENLIPGETIEISFEIEYPWNASEGEKKNQAIANYMTNTSVSRTILSNEVDYYLEGHGLPLIGPSGYPDAPELGTEDITIGAMAVSGRKYTFQNTLRNDGNAPVPIDIEIESTNFDSSRWAIIFKDVLGNELSDTNGNGIPDTGILEPGEDFNIMMTVDIPFNASGNNDGDSWSFLLKASVEDEPITNMTVDIIRDIIIPDFLRIEKSLSGSDLVAAGESVIYEIRVENISEYSVDNVAISDVLPQYLGTPFNVKTQPQVLSESFNSSSRNFTLGFGVLAPGQAIDLTFSATVSEEAAEGTVVENTALVLGSFGTVDIQSTSNTIGFMILNRNIEIVKTATPQTVYPGDEIEYSILILNPSGVATITDLVLEDKIPEGTVYLADSATADGSPTEVSDTGGLLLFSDLPDLSPHGEMILKYSLILESNNNKPLINTALVRGTMITSQATISSVVSSNVASAVIYGATSLNEVTGIVGRIYVDENDNGYCDDEDDPVENLKVFLEDGTFVVSDEDGLFSFVGVKPGNHVVKVDIDESKFKLHSVQDSRDMGNERSFMVWLPEGFFSNLDIRLARTDFGVEKIEKIDPGLLKGFEEKSFIVSGTDTNIEDSKEYYGGFILPANNEVFVGKSRIKVKIGIPEDANYELEINGSLVGNEKIGITSEDLDGNEKYLEYFNVELSRGWNILKMVWRSSKGAYGEETIRVYLSGEGLTIEPIIKQDHIKADGVTKPEINFTVLDENGYRASVSGEVEIVGLDRYYIENGDRESGPVRIPLKNGNAVLKLKPMVFPKVLDFKASWNSASTDVTVEYEPDVRPLLLSGKAQVAYSFEEGLSVDGGLFGRIAGSDGVLTFRMSEPVIDSQKEGYETTGDKSELKDLTPSSEPYFLRLDEGRFNIQLGDYTFNNEEGLYPFARSGFGLSSEYSERNFKTSVFVEPEYLTNVGEELEGQGTRGIYYLSNIAIISNSETIVIVIRDDRGEEIDSKLLRSETDYEFFYNEGYIIFKDPVPRFDADLNRVYIKVDYKIKGETAPDYRMMGKAELDTEKSRYELSFMNRGIIEGDYSFLALETKHFISEKFGASLGGGISFYQGVTGVSIKSAMTAISDKLNYKLDLELMDSFKAPQNREPLSGMVLDSVIRGIDKNLKLVTNYRYDAEKDFGRINIELSGMKNYNRGSLGCSISHLIWGTLLENESEFRLTLNPTIKWGKGSVTSEVYGGLKGKDPTFGINAKLDTEITTDVNLGGEFNFELYDPYSDGSKGEFSTYLTRKLGKITLILKNTNKFLPDWDSGYVVGFKHTGGLKNASVNLGLGSEKYLDGSYGIKLAAGEVNIDLLLEGRYTIDGTASENFSSAHIGFENRSIEELEARTDLDIRLDTNLKLASLLAEGKLYYTGFENIYPLAKFLYLSENENKRFDLKLGMAWRPVRDNDFVLLIDGNYNYSKKKETRDYEVSLALDLVDYRAKDLETSYSLEIYTKPANTYFAAGVSMKTWLNETFSLKGAVNFVLDSNSNFNSRYLLEAGILIAPDLEFFAGYGFGSLDTPFVGDLKEKGLYIGFRIKLDDSWFRKSEDKTILNLSFYKDDNKNGIKDANEETIRVPVSISGCEYEFVDGEDLTVELNPGSYNVELLEIPEGFESIYGNNITLNLEKNDVRSLVWPFIPKPGYVRIKVYEDTNFNGNREVDEDYLENFSVYAGDIQLVSTAASITVPIEPGTVNVSLDIGAFGKNAIPTTKELNRRVSVEPGQLVDLEYGIYFPSKVNVTIYKDENGDGIRQPEEPLADVKATIDISGKPYSVVGQSTLNNIPTGSNTLSIMLGNGDQRRYTFTGVPEKLEVESKETSLIIGIAPKPELSLKFFKDNNRNGIREQSEEIIDELFEVKLNGISIQLFGFVELKGLNPGTHRLTITDIPDGLDIEKDLYELELKPSDKILLEVPVR